MRRPYDDGRLSGQVHCGLAQRGTEVLTGGVRKLHAQHDRRETPPACISWWLGWSKSLSPMSKELWNVARMSDPAR